MQLSEMEEEMDQRIHAAERKTRDQVGPTHAAVIWLLTLPSSQPDKTLNQETEGQLTDEVISDV